MNKTKKVLTIFLTLIMIISSVSIGFNVFGNDVELEEINVNMGNTAFCEFIPAPYEVTCPKCGNVIKTFDTVMDYYPGVTTDGTYIAGTNLANNENGDYVCKLSFTDFTKSGTFEPKISITSVFVADRSFSPVTCHCDDCGIDVDFRMANRTDNVSIKINVIAPKVDAKYTVTREYYVEGVKVDTVTVDNPMVVSIGEELSGQALDEANADWSTYTVDGKEMTFTFGGSNPESITLSENADENVITLAYNHNHADNNGDGKCDDCETNICEHASVKWINNEDGTHYGVCEKCNETVTDNEDHRWDEGKVTTEATCTEDGVKTYTCTKCDATKTEVIEAAGHKEVTIEGTPATCTEDGLTDGVKCSVCGEVIKAQEVIEATGHHDNDGDGKCDDCGTVMTTEPTTPEVKTAKYIVNREYYVEGVKVDTVYSDNTVEAKVDDVIVGKDLAEANADWNTYTVDGKEITFTFDRSTPDSITLSENTTENTITLVYSHNHVDEDGDGKCDNCETTVSTEPTTEPTTSDNGKGDDWCNSDCWIKRLFCNLWKFFKFIFSFCPWDGKVVK